MTMKRLIYQQQKTLKALFGIEPIYGVTKTGIRTCKEQWMLNTSQDWWNNSSEQTDQSQNALCHKRRNTRVLVGLKYLIPIL